MTTWPLYLSIRPLQWVGPRNPEPRYSPFRASWSQTLTLLARELDAIATRTSSATQVLQVDIAEGDFRLDGYPRANAKQWSSAVILSFDSKYGPLSYPCDAFTDWQDNVRAIALAMEALRKVDRYGVTKRGEQYTGWKQLGAGNGAAATGMTADEACRVLLDVAVGPDPSEVPAEVARMQRDRALAVDTFREARIMAHPDRRDGDRTVWDLVETAGRVLGVAS